jgi:hypothetical protein
MRNASAGQSKKIISAKRKKAKIMAWRQWQCPSMKIEENSNEIRSGYGSGAVWRGRQQSAYRARRSVISRRAQRSVKSA